MLPQAENAQEGNLLNATDMPAHTFLAYAGRTSRVIARVAGVLVLAGSLVLVGCEDSVDDLIDDLTTFEIASKPVDSANAELLEGLNFTFTDGGVFDAGLDDEPPEIRRPHRRHRKDGGALGAGAAEGLTAAFRFLPVAQRKRRRTGRD